MNDTIRTAWPALALAFVLAAAPTAAADELTLSIQNGRVTLIAENVPVRRILDEWARIGDSTVVNAEKLTGPPLTLRIVDMPEQQALGILLRSAAGFVAARRPTPRADASQFDRILILAQSRPPAAVAAPPMAAPQPFPMQPVPGLNAVEDHDEPDEPNDFPVPVPGYGQEFPAYGQPPGQFPGYPQPADPGQVQPGMPQPFPPAFQPGVPQPFPQAVPQPFPQPFPGDPNQPQQPVLLSPTPGVVLTPQQPDAQPIYQNPYGQPPPTRPPQPPPDGA